MKKILTASLVAILAVTAANADIASTQYVNAKAGANENGVFTFQGEAAGKTNLTDAINAVATKVAGLSADMGDGGAVSEQIGDAIDALDVDEITVGEGKYVKAVSETDGKVSVTTADLIGQINETGENKNDTSPVAPTTAAVAGYVQNKLNVMTDNVDTKISNALSQTKQDVTGLLTDVANLEANSATKEELNAQNTTLTGDIATAKSEAIADANAYADGLASNYATAEQGAKADVALPKATYDAFVTANETAIATAKSEAIADAKTETQNQIAGLDVTDTAVAGEYVSAVSEADGKISVTRAALTPVAKMNVPEACENGTETCALVYDNVSKGLKWESIVK